MSNTPLQEKRTALVFPNTDPALDSISINSDSRSKKKKPKRRGSKLRQMVAKKAMEDLLQEEEEEKSARQNRSPSRSTQVSNSKQSRANSNSFLNKSSFDEEQSGKRKVSSKKKKQRPIPDSPAVEIRSKKKKNKRNKYSPNQAQVQRDKSPSVERILSFNDLDVNKKGQKKKISPSVLEQAILDDTSYIPLERAPRNQPEKKHKKKHNSPYNSPNMITPGLPVSASPVSSEGPADPEDYDIFVSPLQSDPNTPRVTGIEAQGGFGKDEDEVSQISKSFKGPRKHKQPRVVTKHPDLAKKSKKKGKKFSSQPKPQIQQLQELPLRQSSRSTKSFIPNFLNLPPNFRHSGVSTTNRKLPPTPPKRMTFWKRGSVMTVATAATGYSETGKLVAFPPSPVRFTTAYSALDSKERRNARLKALENYNDTDAAKQMMDEGVPVPEPHAASYSSSMGDDHVSPEELAARLHAANQMREGFGEKLRRLFCCCLVPQVEQYRQSVRA